jgi:hypothetical protein
MQVIVQEVTDAPLSARPDYGPERRTLETVAMDKAAAAIVGAVEKASKRHPLLDKEEDKPSKGKHE